MQLEDPLKTSWKQSAREQTTNLNAVSPYNHHQIKKDFLLENLIVRNYITFLSYENTTSQEHVEAFFESTTID